MNARLLFGLVPAVLISAAWGAGGANLAVAPESKIWVEGTSNVRDYRCEAGDIGGTVVTNPSNASSVVADLQSAVRSAEIEIPVAALDCRNGTMNDHMRRALQAEAQPVIRYRMDALRVVPQADGTGSATITGQLTIAGKTQPITIEAAVIQQGGGAFRVTGSKELRMTDFGVRPPKLMIGMLKVHDPVVVHFDLVLKP